MSQRLRCVAVAACTYVSRLGICHVRGHQDEEHQQRPETIEDVNGLAQAGICCYVRQSGLIWYGDASGVVPSFAI